MARMFGVYQIRNYLNRKVYVGSTSRRGFEKRWENHRTTLRAGRHGNRHLQAAWNKDGEEAFVFEVLEVTDPNQALGREQYWLDTLQPWRNEVGYNVCRTAGSLLGYRHRADSRARMSESGRGRKKTEEHRRKIGEANSRRPPPSEETLDKMREAARRRPPPSAETRRKWSEAARCRRHTSEELARMSQAMKGRRFTPEHLANIRATNRTEARRRQLSEALKDKPKSKEHRESLSRARLGKPTVWGDGHPAATTTEAQVRDVFDRWQRGEKVTAIAREVGVSRSVVHSIVTGRTWNHVTGLPRRRRNEKPSPVSWPGEG